jgi:hypothetical protein
MLLLMESVRLGSILDQVHFEHDFNGYQDSDKPEQESSLLSPTVQHYNKSNLRSTFLPTSGKNSESTS